MYVHVCYVLMSLTQCNLINLKFSLGTIVYKAVNGRVSYMKYSSTIFSTIVSHSFSHCPNVPPPPSVYGKLPTGNQFSVSVAFG